MLSTLSAKRDDHQVARSSLRAKRADDFFLLNFPPQFFYDVAYMGHPFLKFFEIELIFDVSLTVLELFAFKNWLWLKLQKFDLL